MSETRFHLVHLAVVTAIGVSAAAPAAPVSGTAPFALDGGRIYAVIGLVRGDGSVRRVRAFVDLGSAGIALSPALFREMGADRGRRPAIRIGGFSLADDGAAIVAAQPGDFPAAIGAGPVEMVLPAAALRRARVTIDYRRRRLTASAPDGSRPGGVATPFRIDAATGLIAVEARIDGHSYPVTIDAGSTYTWLGKEWARAWLRDRPGWLRGQGAVGAANMRMADDGVESGGALIRIGAMTIGRLRLGAVGALAIGPDSTGRDFIAWYRRKNAAPVIGWLGANVLRHFRLTFDYPNRLLYWQRESADDPGDLDQIGLTLAHAHGDFVVTAVASRAGKPLVAGLRPGDVLLRVGTVEARGARSSAILAALHGRPGETRRLTLARNGRTFERIARISRF